MRRWLAVLAAFGALSGAATVGGQQCPEIVSVLPFGYPDVVAVDGTHLVLGIGHGLVVVDQSDPTAPRSVARLAVPGTVRDIVIDQGLAYLAASEAGVRVVDVSDPTSPHEVQAVAVPGTVQAVAIDGDLLFAASAGASGVAGLYAVSLSPSPSVVGSVATQGDPRDVDVSGPLALVACGPGGLAVIEVADPLHMSVVGSAPGSALAVEAHGSIAFVAAGQPGLRVVDVSVPSSPVQVGQLASGRGEKADLAGDLLLLAGTNGSLQVVDVSTPSSPVVLGALYAGGGGQADVAADGDRAVLAGDRFGLAVVDLSNPAVPSEIGGLPLGTIEEVAVTGDLAVVSSVFDGYPTVVDLSRPDQPRELSTVESLLPGLAVSGPWLYLGGDHLEVFDLSEPAAPVQIGSMPLPYVYDLAVAGGLLHAVESNGDLLVVDVSVPSAPHQVGSLSGSWWYGAVAATEGLAFAGYGVAFFECFSGTTDVVDTADPTQPAVVASVGTGEPGLVRVEEGYLIVVGFGGCLASCGTSVTMVSLTGAAEAPIRGGLWWWIYGCEGAGAAFDGRFLYISRYGSDVRAIDPFTTWDAEGFTRVPLPAARGIARAGRHLLVADEELGLVVLDTACVGALFADGFELGNLAAWSLAFP